MTFFNVHSHIFFTRIHHKYNKPTYNSLCPLLAKLKSNAASFVSNHCNKILGLVHLTLDRDGYQCINNGDVIFVPPANPGPTPAIPVETTQAQIQEPCRQHLAPPEGFSMYNDPNLALKRQIMCAIDNKYIFVLKTNSLRSPNSIYLRTTL